MRQQGRVKAVSGTRAIVTVKRPTACGENCASCSGACTAVLQEIFADNEVGAQPGQNVIIEMDNKNVFKAAFLAYIFPLAALIIGYVLGSIIFHDEIWSALTAFAFMAVSFAIIYFKSKKQAYRHRVVEIINSI